MSRAYCKIFDVFVGLGLMNKGGYGKHMKSPTGATLLTSSQDAFTFSIGDGEYSSAGKNPDGFKVEITRKIPAGAIYKITCDRKKTITATINFYFADGTATLKDVTTVDGEFADIVPLPSGYEYTNFVKEKFSLPNPRAD